MRAIYERELKACFLNFTGYVFLAFLLLFAGIYTYVINLANGVAHYEVTLGNMAFVYIFAIPLLSMRVFPEERKQKTDLLLASLPRSTAEIVGGKYLAGATALLFGVLAMAPVPAVLSFWGEVNFAVAYFALLAFYLLGAALLAFGLLVSSLCDSQAAAAGICFGAMLLLYFLSDLAGFLPGTALASYLALLALAAAGAAAVFWLSRSRALGLAAAGAGIGGVTLFYLLDKTAFEGLLEKGVNVVSPFQRFYAVLGGEADLTLIVFDLSAAALFVFYTVYAVERRRWS